MSDKQIPASAFHIVTADRSRQKQREMKRKQQELTGKDDSVALRRTLHDSRGVGPSLPQAVDDGHDDRNDNNNANHAAYGNANTVNTTKT